MAEGIEDQATLDLLAELGCDIGQGYFIDIPKPATAVSFFSARSAVRPQLPAR